MTIYILQPNRAGGAEAFVVTFMNGTQLLEKVRVLRGKSAVFSLDDPTKPEDADYTYSFVGWNSRDGQESAETGVLDNIQESKAVYAAYSKTHKPVTVTFMNGQEVWDTVTVPYGSTASTSKGDPTKASDDNYDYSFAGWASSDGKEAGESGILNNVTSNKTVYAAYSRARNSFTVTFMNGSIVYDTVKVKKGQNASTSKGNPSKASDDNYDYTFVGWASADGKESSESGILNNITNDKTVYAAYSKERNSFTVTFMNGSIVWDTVKVKKGQNAVCSKGDPSKTEDEKYTYSFVGWASSDGQESALSGILNNITNDKTVYAAYSKKAKEDPVSESPFANTIDKTWDEIIADAEAGNTSGYKELGIKNLRLTDGGFICYELAGIGVDDLADGSGKAAFTFIAKTIDGECQWNTSNDNTGGYPQSNLKKYIEGTCLSHFPSNIRNAMKSVTKTYRMGSGDSGATKSASYTIWPPSLLEMNWSDTSSYRETSGVTYTAYTSYSQRIRYNSSGSASDAWLRSANYSNTNYARCIASTGNWPSCYCSNSFGALPCFCLGKIK